MTVLAAGTAMLFSCAAPDHYVGTTAPDFELEDMSGTKVSLSQHRGHVVLLTFWAVG